MKLRIQLLSKVFYFKLVFMSQGKSPKISLLLLEDETELSGLYNDALNFLPEVEVTSCRNIVDAKSKILEKKFDVIITDWLLNGVTADNLFCLDTSVRDRIPKNILVVTGFTNHKDILKYDCFKEILTKPFSLDELSAKINIIISKQIRNL